jgi:hypothetical protein
MPNAIQSNNTGLFTKQNSVTFDPSLWAATNGTINWSEYPAEVPYTESDVFHTQLTHTPGLTADLGWTLRIGKGGQIYYIELEGFGQITCPQRSFSPWNDDCMTTTVYSADVVNTDDELKVAGFSNDNWVNGYIHGSGMYVKPHMDSLCNKPFYNPILHEEFNSNDRSYSIINWGLVPKPSINRGDVLFYSRYRDIGNGVLELTFYCYNFGNRNYNFAETPWWPVRPSKFPTRIVGVNGTKTFRINNKTFQSGAITSSGGWGAHTVNPSDPNSITSALVWGSNSTATAVNFGVVDTGVRDMALIAPSRSAISMPYGTGIRYRRYAVFGKLKNVSDICSKLNSKAFFEQIEFPVSTPGKLPLYSNTQDGQTILTKTPNGSPVCYTYPVPVKDSLPLLLMKNNDTNTYFLTTDPYAACGKIPFTNPYPVGHAKYNTYQNRHIYQVYDEKSEWITLLGFVAVAPGTIPTGFQRLSEAIPSVTFVAGEKQTSSQLMVLTS